MKNFLFLLCVVLLSIKCTFQSSVGVTCESKYPFCDKGSQLSKIDPNEELDVFYLEAPLFEAKFGHLLGYFDLLHSGVGFQSKKTNFSISLEYDALYEVANATFPFIFRDESGKDGLTWCNQGGVCPVNNIDYTYWTKRITHMATINGSVFNQLVDYVHELNATHTTYEFWDVFDQWGGKQYMQSWTCASFAWAVFGKLEDLGATFDPNLYPHRDFANLYSYKPELVDHTNSDVWQDIVTFYDDFKFSEHKGWFADLETLARFLLGDKFVFYHGQYFKLKMQFPYFGMHYAAFPFTHEPVNLTKAVL